MCRLFSEQNPNCSTVYITYQGGTYCYERTQKTVDGVLTSYTLNGNKITSESGNSGTLHFTYKADGMLSDMTLDNGKVYTYEINSTGDVTGLKDGNGNEVVTYSYNATGKVLNITGSLASTVGVANPFRYHGYYYDTETKLYYQDGEYYNPDLAQFIDSSESNSGIDAVSANLFAYCSNNPVMFTDETGHKLLNENATVHVHSWSYLAVRASASDKAREIGKIFNNEKVEIKEYGSYYSYVKYYIKNNTATKQGWVHSGYLTHIIDPNHMAPANPNLSESVKPRAPKNSNPVTGVDGFIAISNPVTTYYGCGVSYTEFNMYFNSKYDSTYFLRGMGTGVGNAYTDMIIGSILSLLIKNPVLGITYSVITTASETGVNIMVDTALANIKHAKSENICITVTSICNPRAYGFDYLNPYFTVSTW